MSARKVSPPTNEGSPIEGTAEAQAAESRKGKRLFKGMSKKAAEKAVKEAEAGAGKDETVIVQKDADGNVTRVIKFKSRKRARPLGIGSYCSYTDEEGKTIHVNVVGRTEAPDPKDDAEVKVNVMTLDPMMGPSTEELTVNNETAIKQWFEHGVKEGFCEVKMPPGGR
jgi:hypothetical protein